MSKDRALEYRPDIDGLRAIAVLCVIGFHAFPRLLPGGFIGVDIFFVISGFLISGIIFRSLRQRTFSYADFYARRIKRIFPALLTVLTTGIVAGWFLLPPDEYKALGKQSMAGAGFASNLLLWSQAGYFGYFDISAQVNPLLHLWSLGIEEQFYLTWPLIIVFLYKRTKHLALTMGCLVFASFTVNIALTHGSPIAAFYSPLPRFWELLTGAGLAYAMTLQTGAVPGVERGADAASGTKRRIRSEALAWCGLLLLAAALISITKQRIFPGWWALLPTVSTIFIIAARPDAWLNRAVLSSRVLVFVGLISYPLYLWHWFLLAMLRARVDMDGGEAPRLQRLAAIVLSFVLAWLTYMLIEKPIRFGNRRVLRPVALFSLMMGLGVAGAAVYFTDGAAFRYPFEIRPLAALQYNVERDRHAALYRSRKCFLDLDQNFADIAPECADKTDISKPLVVLWGDSHAASLYPGLKAMQDKAGDFRIAQFTAAGCAPIATAGLESGALSDRCRAFDEEALKKIVSLKPDIVLLEADWWLYCMGTGEPNRLILAALQKGVRRLKSAGMSRVVVSGSLPVWDIAQPKVTVKVWYTSGSVQHRTTSYFKKDSAMADTLVEQAIAPTDAVFISPIRELCNQHGCLLSADKGSSVPIAWDSAHLSQAGSELLVAFMFDQIIGPSRHDTRLVGRPVMAAADTGASLRR